MTTVLEGPAWARQGLNQRGGRYPLSVEAPVMSMVDTLVPGVSTLTRYARYFSLYWAIADHAERHSLDAAACQRLVRRSELVLALVSRRHDPPDNPVGVAHGLDAVNRFDPGEDDLWSLAATGRRSYSPRNSGFLSQYLGPCLALGVLTSQGGALRSGPRPCAAAVRDYFAPLLSITAAEADQPLTAGAFDTLASLALSHVAAPDQAPLRELITASRDGIHEPEEWTGNDATRRATLRTIGRAGVLVPDASGWYQAVMAAVAYGPALRDDPVLESVPQAQAWRGVLLRRHSVGAWRQLWAALVDRVQEVGMATRSDLHDWITESLADEPVEAFLDSLPPVTDAAGDPNPAEQIWATGRPADPLRLVGVLLLGSRRADDLSPIQRDAFLRGRATFLDPRWVGRRAADHAQRRLPELGRVFVDDMLAQSRRVALRKVRFERGRMQLFTRLHERNGVYTADSAEGSGNVGLRLEQLVAIGSQLGLLEPGSARATELGARTLAVA